MDYPGNLFVVAAPSVANGVASSPGDAVFKLPRRPFYTFRCENPPGVLPTMQPPQD